MGRSQRDISMLIAARIRPVEPEKGGTGLRLASGDHVDLVDHGAPATAGVCRDDLVDLTRSIRRTTRPACARHVAESVVALENMNAVDTATAEVEFVEALARLTPSQVLCGSLGAARRRGSQSPYPNGGAALELVA